MEGDDDQTHFCTVTYSVCPFCSFCRLWYQPCSATTLWIASPGDQFLPVMKLKRLYISCINTYTVICWTELQLT